MGTSGRDGNKEVITCLMCQGHVAKAELVDHIAGKHLNYELHKCTQCDFANFDAENAAKHQWETDHQVMLNECSYNYNEYAEVMIKKAFEDSVAASAGERRKAPSAQVPTRERVASSIRDIIPPVATVGGKGSSKFTLSDREMHPPPIMNIPQAQTFTEIPSHHVASAGSTHLPLPVSTKPAVKVQRLHVPVAGEMLPPPATISQQVQGSSGVLHRHVSSAGGNLPPPVVRIQRAQPSVKIPHLHDSSASTFTQQNSHRDQCQVCFVVVPQAEKMNHVFNKHMEAIVLCPVSGCDFEVSSNCMSALGKIGNHVKDEHGGFKTLTSDEKAAYDENKRQRRSVAEGVYRDCFCDSPTVHLQTKDKKKKQKRKTFDNFDGGRDAGFPPKVIKHD